MSKLRSFLHALYTPPKMPVKIKNKPLRILFAVIGYLILVFLPAYCTLMLEYIHYADKARAIRFFTEKTPVLLFGFSVMYLIWFCILCICKKGWIASLLYGGWFSLVAFSDYMKHAMTGEYLYPWDIGQQIGNLGELSGFLTVPYPLLYILMTVIIFVLAVIVFFSGAELPLRVTVRLPVLLLTVLLVFMSVSTPEKVTKVLNNHALYIEDTALQTSNYSANGFIGAFTINLLSSNVQKPDGYSRQMVETLMEGREAAPASENFNSPDIILILSESFWDPTNLPGTEFSLDPLTNYRALCAKENTVSGRFFTTGFGGGTVRPEFEVLTGLSADYLPSGCVPWQYVESGMETYLDTYKQLGYTAIAVHPYNSSFYSRKTVYPRIGFDELHFEDDIYRLKEEINVTISGKQISDDTFCSAIEYYLDGHTDTPVFLFGISMENHQPYPDKFSSFTVTAENPAFDDSVANAVRNFTQGVYEADQCLGRLAEYIDQRDRDTVLIWYGDHLPTLGAGFGAYVQSGWVGTFGPEDYEKIYSTPFLVYANFDLTDNPVLHRGTDNDISSYHLLNGAAQLIGAPRTAYMDFLSDYYAARPYYSVRLQGMQLDDAAAKGVFTHKILTYDRIAGGGYSQK